MSNRFFWQVPQCKKFRVIFEDSDIMVGASDDDKYQTFRKDSALIGFSEHEALEQSLALLANFEPDMGVR